MRLGARFDSFLQVTWFHNGEPVEARDNIRGWTDGDRYILTFDPIRAADSGSYKCVASLDGESVETECQILVGGRLEGIKIRTFECI